VTKNIYTILFIDRKQGTSHEVDSNLIPNSMDFILHQIKAGFKRANIWMNVFLYQTFI